MGLETAKLSEIQVPEYTGNLEKWRQYELLVNSGPELYACLPRVINEDDDAHKERILQAVDTIRWADIIQKQIDIQQQSPLTITVKNDARINEFINSNKASDGAGVDGDKGSLKDFMLNSVLRTALAYRYAWVITDRFGAIPEGQNQAQAEAENPMPTSYVIPPQDVPAWAFEPGSQCRVSSCITKIRRPSEMWGLGFVRSEEAAWMLWTPDMVITQDRDGNELEARDNALGIVPICRFGLNDSLMRGMWRNTLEVMNHLSLAGSGAANQIYGLLVISSDRQLSNVNLYGGLQIEAGGKADMVNSPVEGIKFNVDLAEKYQQQIEKALNRRMFSMTVTALQQSGASKKMDSVGEEQFAAYLGSEIKTFFPEIVRHYFAYEGLTIEPDVVVDLPDEYVIQDRAADREDAKYLSESYDPKTKRQWIAREKRLRKLSGAESNMSDKEIADDDKELEEAADRLFAQQDLPSPIINLPAGDSGDAGDSVRNQAPA